MDDRPFKSDPMHCCFCLQRQATERSALSDHIDEDADVHVRSSRESCGKSTWSSITYILKYCWHAGHEPSFIAETSFTRATELARRHIYFGPPIPKTNGKAKEDVLDNLLCVYQKL
jgi:hypothetical protein